MAQKTYSFALGGGLDLVTPAAEIAPGRCIGAKNYESTDEGGYMRIAGYERYDGQLAPSEASYWILDFDAGDDVTPGVDSVCTGQTSGATGVVIAIVVESGSFAGSDAAGYVAIRELSGTFQDNETLSFTGAGDGFSSGFTDGFG